ncbi:MAG: regulatory iron-sulfur-containing complex subunit RicT [Bacteroidales bacterium]|nr:regulatory iron-sulfur-containing complex subunit RicT [Bacteroidales bacterium]
MNQKKTDIYNDFFSRGFFTEPNLIASNEAFFRKSCCKLDTVDWLGDIDTPESQQQRTYVLVRFKNDRKEFFEKKRDLHLDEGDIVAVEASPGHDIGVVSMTGQIVLLQMKRKKVSTKNNPLRKVYRKARMSDIEKWIHAVKREEETKIEARQIAARLKLNMKINDIEYQGDNTKAIFYYTAEERVDFRELIRILADQYKVRIEMKQIGVRQEASKVGGIGSCGREMCCSQWLTDFHSVSTTTARTQQLSLNPQKLAGQCGKLKCCLNYEQKLYEQALQRFPDGEKELETQKGVAIHQKTDVYKEVMWYAYKDKKACNLIPVHLEDIQKIISLNEKGKQPESLEMFAIREKKDTAFNQVVGQDELGRFD